MEKEKLVRKLTDLLDEAARNEFWGSVEIEFRKGQAVLLRRHASEKLNLEENPSERNHYR